MYWASLCRDIPFRRLRDQPAHDRRGCGVGQHEPTYLGPRDNTGHVTPQNLFRGSYPGDTVGPYDSQFQTRPDVRWLPGPHQKLNSYLAGQDFMTDATTFLAVQNGIDSGEVVATDPVPRYVTSGRDLGTFTRQDVLYQAYFVAALVLGRSTRR